MQPYTLEFWSFFIVVCMAVMAPIFLTWLIVLKIIKKKSRYLTNPKTVWAARTFGGIFLVITVLLSKQNNISNYLYENFYTTTALVHNISAVLMVIFGIIIFFPENSIK